MLTDTDARRAYQRDWYKRNRAAVLARKKELGSNPAEYDVEDYTQEFRELTALGLSCREIVTRCTPTQAWFREHVFPFVDRAQCGVCRGYFDPRTVTSGLECGVDCRNTYTGFGTWGKSGR